jgi:hypothetical protein
MFMGDLSDEYDSKTSQKESHYVTRHSASRDARVAGASRSTLHGIGRHTSDIIPPIVMRHPATRPATAGPSSRNFTVPISKRIHSVNSGYKTPPTVNRTPLNLNAQDNAKRALGPNDPENIQIVNMVDNEGMSWIDVCAKLNTERVKTGRKPTFTPNSVHNRYNRNAPILYEAEGKIWVPVNVRKKQGLMVGAAGKLPFWNAERDAVLVECVKIFDEERWHRISHLFNEKIAGSTGGEIDADAAARRFSLI